MLKIKDNVDLKELEKYGYHKEQDYYVDNMFEVALAQVIGTLRIDCKTRLITLIFQENETFNRINDEWYAPGIPNNLYDLIEAGIVEREHYE